MNMPQLPLCDQRIAYLLGELSEKERLLFEQHLRSCESCNRELHHLMPTHALLSGNRIDVSPDVSSEQKMRTLAQAFAARAPYSLWEDPSFAQMPAADVEPKTRNTNVKRFAWTRFSSHSAGKRAPFMQSGMALAAIAFLFVGYWFGVSTSHRNIPPQSLAVSNTPLTYASFAPANAHIHTTGVVMLIHNKGTRELVVWVHGLDPLQPGTCYTVWLVQGHTHRKAGLLQVKPNGIGVLTARVPENMTFSAVNISHEPHMNDPKPQGPMILHASTRVT